MGRPLCQPPVHPSHPWPGLAAATRSVIDREAAPGYTPLDCAQLTTEARSDPITGTGNLEQAYKASIQEESMKVSGLRITCLATLRSWGPFLHLLVLSCSLRW